MFYETNAACYNILNLVWQVSQMTNYRTLYRIYFPWMDVNHLLCSQHVPIFPSGHEQYPYVDVTVMNVPPFWQTVLHNLYSEPMSLDAQKLNPSHSGTSLCHTDRSLYEVPPPQVWVQVDHTDQSAQ